MSASVFPPGSRLGILGGGQLGRMTALAARALGYPVAVYSEDAASPAGQVADVEVVGAYDDPDAITAFAATVDVLTFEFENVSAEATARAARVTCVRPDGHVLHTTQHRAREKRWLASQGVPTAPFRIVATRDELDAAIAAIGVPGILKTAAFGYDGKGQVRVVSPDAADGAWQTLREQECVYEALVGFVCEVSVVTARGVDDSLVDYGVIENAHAHHILDVSRAPARVERGIADEAIALARRITRALNVVGVLCTEMFVTGDGRVLVNELAPRPHNSGHLTIDACVTSQFEQHVRAVCGMPLGDPGAIGPAAMANLLGDLWRDADPDWASACGDPAVKLHLYGKREPRPGRKMGHLTVVGSSIDDAAARVVAARARLAVVR